MSSASWLIALLTKVFAPKRGTTVRAASIALLAVVAFAVSSTGVASAGPTPGAYHVYSTGDGLYLHPDSPTLQSSLTDLMPDGTEFDITCWQNGDDVNGDSVWDFGTDASTGDSGFASDFYLDTPVTQGNEGSQLTALGIPQCGASGDSPSGATSETPVHHDGDYIANSGSLAYDLYDHYMWGDGRPAVLDPSIFGERDEFLAEVDSLPINKPTSWSFDWLSEPDMFLALGTFTITRTSEHCWAVYDHYDFSPSKLPNWLYQGFNFYRVSGARNFDVHSSGCNF